MTSRSKKDLKNIGIGLAFILPNLIGFLMFTLFPLLASLYMAFTNWDLTLHNIFKTESIQFIGFENFGRLFKHPDFWQYFGNTLFLMIGIPFSIGASLLAALLISQKLRTGYRALPILCIIGIPSAACFLILGYTGVFSTNFAWILCGVVAFFIAGGALGGTSFYRTVYYLPNFTAGVATYLLWKKMYDPNAGPVNAVLQPVLDGVSRNIGLIDGPAQTAVRVLFYLGAAALFAKVLFWARSAWLDEEAAFSPRTFRKWRAAGLRLLFGFAGVFILASIAHHLPGWTLACRHGLQSPHWLTDFYWSKPALMIMSIWISAGSTNMLLYVAGLTNVPSELYEAADIDGASPSQRFRYVTWPQLAPITFFITIMSVIGGLQGGFETARAMTQGGPGGATTTISYFVFSEGFETGRLGLASAIAWTLFAFVFVVTIFNWRFGKDTTNE